MNRRLYLIPALLSLSLHGLLFYTDTRPRPPVDPMPGLLPRSTREMPPFVEVVPETPEPDPFAVMEAPSPQRLGTPLPGLEDLVRPSDPGSFVMEAERTVSLPLDAEKVLIGVRGDPKGVLDGVLSALPSASSLVDISQLDNLPRTRYQPSPHYPEAAKRDGLSGVVELAFVVTENGEVRNLQILRSSDPRFNEPALRALARWRFEPGRKYGKPVAFKMRQPLSFDLREQQI